MDFKMLVPKKLYCNSFFHKLLKPTHIHTDTCITHRPALNTHMLWKCPTIVLTMWAKT